MIQFIAPLVLICYCVAGYKIVHWFLNVTDEEWAEIMEETI